MKITSWFSRCDLHEYGDTLKSCAEHAIASGAELNDAKLNGAQQKGGE